MIKGFRQSLSLVLLTPPDPAEAYSLLVCPFHLQDTLKFKRTENLKGYFYCPQSTCKAAKKKKKDDLEMEEALNHMIQEARTMVEAIQTEKTIDQGIQTEPLPSPSPTEPPTPAEPAEAYSLLVCPFHPQETLKFKRKENLKGYFYCPQSTCHIFAEEGSILEILQFCNNYTHPEVQGQWDQLKDVAGTQTVLRMSRTAKNKNRVLLTSRHGNS